jgi:histidyl-tRNA synthetase
LRKQGISCLFDTGGRSMKAQMKEADREHATWCLIVGDTELSSGEFVLRNMSTSTEETLDLSAIHERVRL